MEKLCKRRFIDQDRAADTNILDPILSKQIVNRGSPNWKKLNQMFRCKDIRQIVETHEQRPIFQKLR